MFKPIGQKNLMREILAQIKQNVYEGKLKKGDKLPAERELAAALGVSRTTLREAIKSLEMLGLVECVQGGGNYISENLTHSMSEPLSVMFLLEHGTYAQVYQFRQAMEIAAAQGAAANATAAQIAELEDICVKLENQSREDDYSRSDLDLAFHVQIAKMAGNPIIITMLNAADTLINNQIRYARMEALQDHNKLGTVNQQHRSILEHIKRGDVAGIPAVIEKHIQYSIQFYREHLGPDI